MAIPPPSWSQLVKTFSRFICRTECLNFRETPVFSPNSSPDILSKKKTKQERKATGIELTLRGVKPYILKMFGRNTYQIPQVSHSSLHSRDSASVIGYNEVELCHHHHLFSESYLASNAPVNVAASSFTHDSGGGGINGDSNSCPTKQVVKKDRHSKIYTSQGPRDRRVRLSIGIARKFFDLQEMLGVDKPSKTLDWLLTKSKTAIKDLVQTKQNDVSSTTENNVETLENGKSVGKRKSAGKQKGGGEGGGGGGGGGGRTAKDPLVNLAKESRMKARARARERTREKMCIKQQQQLQQCMNNQLEICKISGAGNNTNTNNGFCLPSYEEAVNNQDIIQESIVIKRKVKHPSSILGFQQNLIISNSGIPSPYPTSENWDISNFNSQANIYAIWDQHRFINSTSNN